MAARRLPPAPEAELSVASVAEPELGGRRRAVAALGALGLALLGGPLGCGAGGDSRPVGASQPARGEPVEFSYAVPEGEVIHSASLRGRATALLFMTSYDLNSQMLARRLDAVLRRHKPRANALAVALEPPMNAPFVLEFRESLSLRYPIAMAGPATLRGEGPFGDVRQVPIVVVLDYRGRVVWHGAGGVVSEEDLEAALKRGSR